jgi:hypothetical protein
MKKTLIMVMLGGVMGLLVSVAVTGATTLTLSQDQLLLLWDVFENPENATTRLLSKTPTGGSVEFVGIIADSGGPFSPFAQIGIGANFQGSSSTGFGPTTAAVVGTNDVSSFDRYALGFFNANDAPWSVSLFMNTGFTDPPFSEPNNFYSTGFTSLPPGGLVAPSCAPKKGNGVFVAESSVGIKWCLFINI